MVHDQSISTDEYYQDYLRETSNQNKKNNDSPKKIIIGLFSMILIGGCYYVWEQQNITKTIVKHETKRDHVVQNTKVKTLEQTIKPIIEKQGAVITKVSSNKLHPVPVVSKVKIENNIKKPIPVQTKVITKKIIDKKIVQRKIKPVIKEKATIVEKKVSQPSVIKSKLLQENKKINDLAQALLTGIVEGNTPLKEQKIVKINTLNKVLVKQKIKPSKKRKDPSQVLKDKVKTRVDEIEFIIVQKGDTLFDIAKRVYGDAMKYSIILEANPSILNDPARISIGQKLRVPKLKRL